MKVRKPNGAGWFSDVEEAELRRLVCRAFKLRDGRDPAAYKAALQAIEDWQIETAPERMRRNIP